MKFNAIPVRIDRKRAIRILTGKWTGERFEHGAFKGFSRSSRSTRVKFLQSQITIFYENIDVFMH